MKKIIAITIGLLVVEYKDSDPWVAYKKNGEFLYGKSIGNRPSYGRLFDNGEVAVENIWKVKCWIGGPAPSFCGGGGGSGGYQYLFKLENKL